MRLFAVLLAVVTLASAPGRAAAQRSKAVLAAGQAVFDAMGKRDTAELRRLLHPAVHLIATSERDGKPESRVSTLQDFLGQIGLSSAVPLERMWDAEVRVSGGIATVWTQYDFHRDGQFSHCGIDSFQFVQGADGWAVTSIIYTVVRDHCPKNPIGPPR